LNDALDIVDAGNRNMEASVAIAPLIGHATHRPVK
jgi:hypothetical protein